MTRNKAALVVMTILLSAALAWAGSGTKAPVSTPELKQAFATGKKTIVFFMNPAGGPCNMQNEILHKLHQDRKGNFNVVPISTMNPADQRAFYDYGVKGLPAVVLVDGSGKISKYFPPGIQTYETLAQALDAK